MELFCINSMGAKVIIDTDVELKEYLEANKEKMEIPNLKIMEDGFDDVKNILEYRNVSIDERFVKCENDIIQLHYPKDRLTSSNIIYCSKYLILKQIAERGIIPCHSSCVEKDGKAILILGIEGAGKTSVALNLCLKYGYGLISNDQTLIGMEDGKLKAFWGTKFINLRYASVKENMPQLIGLFGETEVESWSEKLFVMAKDLGVREVSQPTEIEQIIVLHTDNRSKSFISKPGDNWKNNFYLYKDFTENIRNTTSTIVDKSGHPIGYVPSYDTEQLYSKRVEIINYINENPNYRYLSGRLENIIDDINNVHRNIIEREENEK